MTRFSFQLVVGLLLLVAFLFTVASCARLSRAWEEADYRARYAPVAKEVVKP